MSYFQSLSARLLTAFWWLFCLVIVFIYVISLKNLIFGVDSGNDLSANHHIEDLLENDNFKFVVYPQGSSQNLLEVGTILHEKGFV